MSAVKKKAIAKNTRKKVSKKKPSKKLATKIPVRSKKYLEILLSSLSIKKIGQDHQANCAGVILFNWLYARPDQPTVAAIIPFTGLKKSNSNDDALIDFSDKQHGEPYLFKQITEGDSVITAEVAITKNTGLISKIISSTIALEQQTNSNLYVASKLGIILDHAGLTNTSVRVVGQTSFEIPGQNASGNFQGQLHIPQAYNVFKNNNYSYRADKIDYYDADEFKTGSSNGELVISIK